MADKSVGELIAAQSVTPTDLFVLEQNGTAKKLTGQILENWLVSFADGHGGIQSIAKLGTSGLADTYRITLADTTTFDFVVTNGRGISSLRKTATSGLVDTYTFTYNDGTTGTFTVTNGEKGDKGDNAYIWVKYASQEPTASSNSFGDLPDDWMGVYFGTASAAPSDWQQYKWYRVKGDKGETGDPATLVSSEISYQAGDSGTIIPSGNWSSNVPTVTPGRYLWTRQVLRFNTGDPITSYGVSRFGIDGTGAVSSVAGVAPDENGNVPLDAASVRALPLGGGIMEGSIDMNGQKLSGLNAPTEDDEPATKGYADNLKPDLTGYATETYVNGAVKKAAPRNLLDNSNFANPVNQRGLTSHPSGSAIYTIDRWKKDKATAVDVAAGYLILQGEDNGFSHVFPPETLNRISGKPITMAVKLKGASDGARVKIGISGGGGYNEYTLTGEWETVIWTNSFDFANNSNWTNFVIRPSGEIYVEWAAVYEGEYTADTLPEYQPKGYATELAECQRYCIVSSWGTDDYLLFFGYIANTTTFNAFAYLPVPMRINPSISNTDGSNWSISAGTKYTPTNITSWLSSNNAVLAVKATISDGVTSTFGTMTPNSETKIVFSADL